MDKLDRVDDAIEEYTYALRLLDLEQLHHDDDENDHEKSSNNVVPSSTSSILRQQFYHNNKIHRAFVYYNRGICLDRLGRLPSAVDDFTKAIDTHPHAQHIISPATNTDASESVTHTNTTHANALADFYHNRGFALLKLTHYHRAISGNETHLVVAHAITTKLTQIIHSFHSYRFSSRLGTPTHASTHHTLSATMQGSPTTNSRVNDHVTCECTVLDISKRFLYCSCNLYYYL